MLLCSPCHGKPALALGLRRTELGFKKGWRLLVLPTLEPCANMQEVLLEVSCGKITREEKCPEIPGVETQAAPASHLGAASSQARERNHLACFGPTLSDRSSRGSRRRPAESAQLAYRTERESNTAVLSNQVSRWFVMQHKITEAGMFNLPLSAQPLPAQVPAC